MRLHIVNRDVKNVHEELSQFAQLDTIFFEEDWQDKRSVVWFNGLVISFPFNPEVGDTTTAAP